MLSDDLAAEIAHGGGQSENIRVPATETPPASVVASRSKAPTSGGVTADSSRRVWRTVYRRQRDLDRHPGIDPARLPLNVYSSSDVLAYQREDLAYLRSAEEPGVREAWIETRIEHPWERTDD